MLPQQEEFRPGTGATDMCMGPRSIALGSGHILPRPGCKKNYLGMQLRLAHNYWRTPAIKHMRLCMWYFLSGYVLNKCWVSIKFLHIVEMLEFFYFFLNVQVKNIFVIKCLHNNIISYKLNCNKNIGKPNSPLRTKKNLLENPNSKLSSN